MRTLQILASGVFAALLVACGAWALAWFGTSSGPPNAIQAAAEPKSPKSTIALEVAAEPKSPKSIIALEVAPERESSGEIPAAPEGKSVSCHGLRLKIWFHAWRDADLFESGWDGKPEHHEFRDCGNLHAQGLCSEDHSCTDRADATWRLGCQIRAGSDICRAAAAACT